MSKMEGHLVGFGAATNLEEQKSGYSEIGADLPSGTCRYNKTSINAEGERYLLNPDTDGYEARKESFNQKQAEELLSKKSSDSSMPKWLQEKLAKYEGKGLDRQVLEEKFRDGFSRRETVKKLRAAKTKEEKMEILEEYHREAEKCRKRTALKLKCMEATRTIRKEVAQGIPATQRTYRTLSSGR